MKTVPFAKFKEQCMALLDHIKGIIITKHGKPVAKLVPIQTDSVKLIGSFKGQNQNQRGHFIHRCEVGC
jgi:antitoxin (DNA-binding transcriptional repressor) of toxin-antitoxin stability system